METALRNALGRLGDLVPSVGTSLKPLSKVDVAKIEQKIGRELDPVHKELLLIFGASRFDCEVVIEPEVKFPMSYSKSNRGYVNGFLGKINPDFPRARSICILHLLDSHEDDLPEDFLPFADVGTGDLYGTRDNGAVELWIHDARRGKELVPVAGSFEAWLDRLQSS